MGNRKTGDDALVHTQELDGETRSTRHEQIGAENDVIRTTLPSPAQEQPRDRDERQCFVDLGRCTGTSVGGKPSGNAMPHVRSVGVP